MTSWEESKSIVNHEKVIRSLISEELCGIHDQPMTLRPKVKDKFSISFLDEILSKLLMQVGVAVVKRFRQKEGES